MSTTTVLPGLTIVRPLIEVWSGTVKFDHRQVVSDAARSELPPSELASDGRLSLVPGRTALTKLLSTRKGVERLLKSKGFQLLGGYAVATSDLPEVMAELANLEQQFNVLVDDLVINRVDLYAEQQTKFPKWADLLKANEASEATIRARCVFDVAVFEVSAPQEASAATRLTKAASNAYPALLETIAAEAEDRLEAVVKLPDVNQRSVNPVRELIDKLDTFSFIDASVAPLVSALRGQMALLPHNGKLSMSEMGTFVSILQTLADPSRLLQFGMNAITATSSQPLLDLRPADPVPLEVLPVEQAIDEIKELLSMPFPTPSAPVFATFI